MFMQTGATDFEEFQIVESSENGPKRHVNKYNLLGLFVLVNPKLLKRQPVEENEADVVQISYNMSFGNLKINFYKITNETFNGHVLFLDKLELLISGVIYPENIFRILYENDKSFGCIERLIKFTGEDWQFERPILYVDIKEDYIAIKICDKDKNQYYYTFANWQKEAFKWCCDFSLNKGLQLAGTNIIINQQEKE